MVPLSTKGPRSVENTTTLPPGAVGVGMAAKLRTLRKTKPGWLGREREMEDLMIRGEYVGCGVAWGGEG